MIFLIISIFASSAIGIVMRLSQGRVQSKIGMIAGNYIACIIASLFFLGGSSVVPRTEGINTTLLLGIINGAIYLGTLILQEYSIKKTGVVLPSVFARLGSLIVPLFISIVFFSERPGMFQLAGALLAVAAIIAMNGGKNEGSFMLLPLLLLLFADGMASSMSKIFDHTGLYDLRSHFLLYTFFFAFILSLITMAVRKEKFGLPELLYGFMIGVPNYFASRFLLLALSSIPAVVAYPIRSIGSIMVLAFAGVFVFHEKLTKRQWYAVAVILAAVVLLSI